MNPFPITTPKTLRMTEAIFELKAGDILTTERFTEQGILYKNRRTNELYLNPEATRIAPYLETVFP